MKYVISIPNYDCSYLYDILPSGDYQVIDLPDVVHFSIVKHHNHCYELAAFFCRRRLLI